MTEAARRRFLSQVEAFLAESGLSASRFSRDATGDPSFVTGLRAGWPSIGQRRVAKARAFMRDWRP